MGGGGGEWWQATPPPMSLFPVPPLFLYQCCNKSSHWLRLESHLLMNWLDSESILPKMTWLESQVKMTLTWLWLNHNLTRVEWLKSWHTHTRLSAWIMWSCEPWLCPHLLLGEKIENWYYLVTSASIKMFHSTLLWFFFYTVVEMMTTQLTKYFCQFTKGEYTTPWVELTWRKKLLDLTWLDKNINDLTWLATQVLLTWLVTRARVTCYNTVLYSLLLCYKSFYNLW